MVAELAMDEWTVTCESIEKRVDRYEIKAKLKRKYGKRPVVGKVPHASFSESAPLLICADQSDRGSHATGDDEHVDYDLTGVVRSVPRALSVSVQRQAQFGFGSPSREFL